MQPTNKCESTNFFPIIKTLVSGFWKKLMYDLRLSSSLILTERRWWLFFLASWREAYWVRNVSITSVKLWSERGGSEWN